MSLSEQLATEGFIEGHGSSGAFVADLALPPKPSARQSPNGTAKAPGAISAGEPLGRPFRVGEPGLDLFPIKLWNRLAARRARSPSTPERLEE